MVVSTDLYNYKAQDILGLEIPSTLPEPIKRVNNHIFQLCITKSLFDATLIYHIQCHFQF